MKLKALFLLGLTLLVSPGCMMAVMAAARAAKPKTPDPLVTTLDTNHDGVIDSAEMANATAALKALDQNGDGVLRGDELKAPRRK